MHFQVAKTPVPAISGANIQRNAIHAIFQVQSLCKAKAIFATWGEGPWHPTSNAATALAENPLELTGCINVAPPVHPHPTTIASPDRPNQPSQLWRTP
jgi:hypothetical protein